MPEIDRSLEGAASRVKRYGVAIIASGIAFAATYGLRRMVPPVPTDVLFAAAVALSAWFGGRGAGFLSGVISILGIDYLDLPPVGHVELTHPAEVVHFAAFLLVVLIISSTTEALRRARQISETRARDLERLNARLAEQVEEVRQLSEELQTANEHLVDSRDEAERVAARATGLQEVTAALSDASTVADVGRVVTGAGLDAIQATRGYLGVLSSDRTHIEMISTRGLDDEQTNRLREIPLTADSPLAIAVRRGEPLWFGSTDELREQFPAAAAHIRAPKERRTHASIPLVHRGEIIGALSLNFDEPTATGAVDRAFTLLLAQDTAAALARARSYDVEREKRREAEILARGREEVLGVVAHDLRNPLNLVGATLQFLEEIEPGPDRKRELYVVIHRAVGQMNRLIGDLLDTVRLQAGRLSLELERVDVGEVLRQTEETFRANAAARQIQLQTSAPEGVIIEADGGRLAQALGNLVGNALKFTPEGGKVVVRASRPADDDAVRFEVVDNGPGISPESRDHLFDRFWQARTDKRGVGLGLAITKGIVDAHGGRIEVESQPGKGSTFAITVPAHHDGDGAQRSRRQDQRVGQPPATNAV